MLTCDYADELSFLWISVSTLKTEDMDWPTPKATDVSTIPKPCIRCPGENATPRLQAAWARVEAAAA